MAKVGESTDFKKLLLKAVDDALTVLGESPKLAIFSYLEIEYSLNKDTIPEKLDVFSASLDGIFGSGSQVIKKLILKNLCAELGLEYEERDISFLEYVAALKAVSEGGCKGLEREEILDFVRNVTATDHIILFYEKQEDKHQVLFTYLKAGLDKGEAAAYVASEDGVEQINQAMRGFGVDVDQYKKMGALSIIDYRDWYLKGGKFNIPSTIQSWKALYDKTIAEGFKGLRVAGEVSFFFKHDLVKELMEYERAIHRRLEIPMTVICAYNTNVVAKVGEGRVFLDLVKAHRYVIFTGPEAGLVKSY